MKKFAVIILSIALLGLCACAKIEVQIVYSEQPTAPVMAETQPPTEAPSTLPETTVPNVDTGNVG